MTDNLTKYKKYRTLGKDLITRLFKELSGSQLKNAGRQLGILKKNKLVMEKEEEVDLYADFAINSFKDQNGKTAVQRFIEKHNEELKSEERDLLEPLLTAKASLFKVNKVNKEKALILLADVFNEEKGVEILDIGFSSSLSVNRFLMYTRIMRVGGISMTTGVAMLFKKEDESLLLEKYRKLEKKISIKDEDAKRYAIFFKLNRQLGYKVGFRDL